MSVRRPSPCENLGETIHRGKQVLIALLLWSKDSRRGLSGRPAGPLPVRCRTRCAEHVGTRKTRAGEVWAGCRAFRSEMGHSPEATSHRWTDLPHRHRWRSRPLADTAETSRHSGALPGSGDLDLASVPRGDRHPTLVARTVVHGGLTLVSSVDGSGWGGRPHRGARPRWINLAGRAPSIRGTLDAGPVRTSQSCHRELRRTAQRLVLDGVPPLRRSSGTPACRSPSGIAVPRSSTE